MVHAMLIDMLICRYLDCKTQHGSCNHADMQISRYVDDMDHAMLIQCADM